MSLKRFLEEHLRGWLPRESKTPTSYPEPVGTGTPTFTPPPKPVPTDTPVPVNRLIWR